MFGRIVKAAKKISRQTATTGVQVSGVITVAVGVGMLAGLAWALIAVGAATVVFGTVAEVS